MSPDHSTASCVCEKWGTIDRLDRPCGGSDSRSNERRVVVGDLGAVGVTGGMAITLGLGSIFIWLLVAAIVSVVALALRLVFGFVGLGLRLAWLVLALPILILAAVFAAPVLVVGLVVLIVCMLAGVCRR